MTPRRLVAILTLSITAALTGCSPGSAPADVQPAEPRSDLNDARDTAGAMVDKIMAKFPEAEPVTSAEPAPSVNHCVDEDPEVGYWLDALAFTTTDIPGGVESTREAFADIETSHGTSAQDIEYADGTTWPVAAQHVLLEDESGSYLITYGGGESGYVQIRVVTSCAELD